MALVGILILCFGCVTAGFIGGFVTACLAAMAARSQQPPPAPLTVDDLDDEAVDRLFMAIFPNRRP